MQHLALGALLAGLRLRTQSLAPSARALAGGGLLIILFLTQPARDKAISYCILPTDLFFPVSLLFFAPSVASRHPESVSVRHLLSASAAVVVAAARRLRSRRSYPHSHSHSRCSHTFP